jgi:hypothetical protein
VTGGEGMIWCAFGKLGELLDVSDFAPFATIEAGMAALPDDTYYGMAVNVEPREPEAIWPGEIEYIHYPGRGWERPPADATTWDDLWR